MSAENEYAVAYRLISSTLRWERTRPHRSGEFRRWTSHFDRVNFILVLWYDETQVPILGRLWWLFDDGRRFVANFGRDAGHTDIHGIWNLPPTPADWVELRLLVDEEDV